MRKLSLLMLALVVGCSQGAAQAPKKSPLDAAADRILKSALLEGALDKYNKLFLDIHARRADEPLDVSIGYLLVRDGRVLRGADQRHLEFLKTHADVANIQMGIALKLLTSNAEFVTNTVKVESAHQDVLNDANSPSAEIELKRDGEFTTDDANDVVAMLPILTTVTDVRIKTARDAIRQELEKFPELMKPFAAEKPVSAEVVKSRQRIAAMVMDAKRKAGR